MPAQSSIIPLAARLWGWTGAGFLLVAAGTAGAFEVEDGYAPQLDGAVNALAVQPSGHGIVGGEFTSINGGSCARLCRLDAAGRIAAGFGSTGLNGDVFALLVESDGAVTVGGAFTEGFGRLHSRLLRMNAAGSIEASAGAGVNGTVRALARQTDGRLLIGGDFSQIGGSWPSRRVARQLASGSVDTSFLAEVDGSVLAIALLDDGRIVIGGTFANVSGVARQNLAVLRPNGQIDFNATFNANGAVRSITRDLDGTLVIGGAFTQIDGIALSRLARMTPDGASVYGLAAAEAGVRATHVHSDGQLILGGDFLAIDNQPRARLARLDQERQLDSAWRAVTGDSVHAIAEQPDGSLLVGGRFVSANGEARSRLARVSPQGQLERTLVANVNPGGAVLSSADLADGGIVLGGNFTSISGQPRERLARLRADGALDPDFTPTANGDVRTLAVLDDGGLLLTGSFTQINGNPRPGLAKLLANGSLDPDFTTPTFGTFGMPTFAEITGAYPQARRGRIYVTGSFDTVNTLPSEGIVRLRLQTGNPENSLAALVQPGVTQLIETEDSSLLIVGGSTVNGIAQPARLSRLLAADGSLDTSFVAQVGPGNTVTKAALLPDGKILVAVRQAQSSGVPIRRLRIDGSPDSSFTAVADGPISSIAVRADGVIAIAGQFTRVSGLPRSGYALLGPNGAVLDALPTALGVIHGARFQRDGKLILTGAFSSIGAQPRSGLARLSTPQAALYALEVDGLSLRWLRGGAAPELNAPPQLFAAEFGFTPVPQEEFRRVPGGWQVDIAGQLFDPGLLRLKPRSIDQAVDGSGLSAQEYLHFNLRLFGDGFEPR